MGNLTGRGTKTLVRAQAQGPRGARFRRQFPIGSYIAGFCGLKPKLIIEVDGGQHAERQEYDRREPRAKSTPHPLPMRVLIDECVPKDIIEFLAARERIVDISSEYLKICDCKAIPVDRQAKCILLL